MTLMIPNAAQNMEVSAYSNESRRRDMCLTNAFPFFRSEVITGNESGITGGACSEQCATYFAEGGWTAESMYRPFSVSESSLWVDNTFLQNYVLFIL